MCELKKVGKGNGYVQYLVGKGNSDDLFSRITVEADAELVPHKTLIFIDEVQEAKEVVTFIKLYDFLCVKIAG